MQSPLDSSIFSADSDHDRSNMYFLEQGEAREAALYVNALPFRCHHLHADPHRIARRNFYQVQPQIQRHCQACYRQNRSQFHRSADLHLGGHHHLPWNQPVLDQLLRFIHQANRIRRSGFYYFVCDNQELHFVLPARCQYRTKVQLGISLLTCKRTILEMHFLDVVGSFHSYRSTPRIHKSIQAYLLSC